MSSVNKVILIGNLGNDPEIRALGNGKEVANLSIATSETWKDKQTGERKEKTEWHRVVIFNEGLVGVAKNYLHKGMKVYIEGKLQTRKWTDTGGVDRYSTEIALNMYDGVLVMVSGKNDGAQSSHGEAKQNGYQAQQNAIDDEIPF